MLSENYATKNVSKLGQRASSTSAQFGKDPNSLEGQNRAMTKSENIAAKGDTSVVGPMSINKLDKVEEDFKTHDQKYQKINEITNQKINQLQEDREFQRKAKGTIEGIITTGQGIMQKNKDGLGKAARGAYSVAETLGDFDGPTGTATAIEGVFSGDMEKIKSAASQQATEKIVQNTVGKMTENASALGGASGAVAGLIQGQGAVESGVRGAASAGAAAVAAPLGPLASGAAAFLADSVASLFFPSGDDPIGPKTKIGRETLGTPTAKEILTDYADA